MKTGIKRKRKKRLTNTNKTYYANNTQSRGRLEMLFFGRKNAAEAYAGEGPSTGPISQPRGMQFSTVPAAYFLPDLCGLILANKE